RPGVGFRVTPQPPASATRASWRGSGAPTRPATAHAPPPPWPPPARTARPPRRLGGETSPRFAAGLGRDAVPALAKLGLERGRQLGEASSIWSNCRRHRFRRISQPLREDAHLVQLFV